MKLKPCERGAEARQALAGRTGVAIAQAPAVVFLSGVIYGSRRWKFLIAVTVIALAKSGIWVIPTIKSYEIQADDPFHYHRGLSFLPENWLHTFLGWLLLARDWKWFALLNLVMAVAFLLVMFSLFFTRLSDRSARTATLVFMAMPVSTTAFYWLGLDSLTVLLLALALLAMRHWWLVLPIAVLLGLQHFEQGLATALLVAGARGIAIMLRQRPWRSLVFPSVLGLGLVAGRLLLSLFYELWHIRIDYNRIDWFHDNLPRLVRQYAENPLLIWFSILGVAWLVIVRFAMQGMKALPLIAALVVLAGATILYEDHTRVACILSLVLIVTEMLLNEEFIGHLGSTEVVGFAALWLIAPFVWVWGAYVQSSTIVYDVQIVLNRLFGWFNAPHGDSVLFWPFLLPSTDHR